MARKSKRMALNDAIRRGQAKIEEGLKTGHMRSDGPSAQRAEEDKRAFLGPKSGKQNPVEKCRALFLKSKETSAIRMDNPSRGKVIALLWAAAVVVAALGLWLVLLIRTPESEKTPASGFTLTETEQKKAERLPDHEPLDSAEALFPESEPSSPPSRGDNVICIKSISFGRKDELGVLADFFRRKGIETEIISVDGPSGRLAVLATKDGFEQNPVKKGADGYELAQRIKQLGPVYVEETKDTKFGVKPFQDVYGRKR